MQSALLTLVQNLRDTDQHTLRTVCPSCGAKSFSISWTTDSVLPGVVYNCYRASCSFKGMLFLHNQEYTKTTRKPKPSRRWGKNTITIPDEGIQFLQSNYPCLFPTGDDIPGWWKWHEKEQAIVVPISGLLQQIDGTFTKSDGLRGNRPPGSLPLVLDFSGYLFKYADRSHVPKVYAENWVDLETYSLLQLCYQNQVFVRSQFKPPKGMHSLVLVEDFLSAHALEKHGVSAIALLGTNINEKFLEYLSRSAKVHRCIIALDRDTWEHRSGAKPIKLLQDYNWYFCEGMRAALLDADLKDCDDATISSFKEEYCT